MNAYDKDVAGYLEENRMSATQTLKPLPDGRFLVKFQSEDTNELRQWLIGFGAAITVRKPAAVKKWIAETARELTRLYEGDAV